MLSLVREATSSGSADDPKMELCTLVSLSSIGPFRIPTPILTLQLYSRRTRLVNRKLVQRNKKMQSNVEGNAGGSCGAINAAGIPSLTPWFRSSSWVITLLMCVLVVLCCLGAVFPFSSFEVTYKGKTSEQLFNTFGFFLRGSDSTHAQNRLLYYYNSKECENVFDATVIPNTICTTCNYLSGAPMMTYVDFIGFAFILILASFKQCFCFSMPFCCNFKSFTKLVLMTLACANFVLLALSLRSENSSACAKAIKSYADDMREMVSIGGAVVVYKPRIEGYILLAISFSMSVLALVWLFIQPFPLGQWSEWASSSPPVPDKKNATDGESSVNLVSNV